MEKQKRCGIIIVYFYVTIGVKQLKPETKYNILLAVTIIACVITVVYNFILQDVLGSIIEYRMPVVEQQASGKFAGIEPVLEYADDTILEEIEAAEPERYVPKPNAEAVGVKFPLEINMATKDQIMLIPRVGNVIATRIVQYREVLGEYTSLEQLMQIKNIGEKTYLYLSQYFYIAGDDWDTGRGEAESLDELPNIN